MLLSQTEPAVAGNMAAAGCDSHSEDDIHCTNSVHTLNQRPVLHPVYLKYSETEYWAENKTDSIPGTGYLSHPDPRYLHNHYHSNQYGTHNIVTYFTDITKDFVILFYMVKTSPAPAPHFSPHFLEPSRNTYRI